ncbi:putative membrane protein YdjX (TVP38/TMEM64 family) [Salsuginibacillus halophilus]|uniref:TVP38/TMEM64 family membrane protein n=1 Tax=Salsuginibacillus halophilus TaxID=517424 RepID=A0A2P8HCU2_9BACI|nr:VTT domain-containing protein [Salsuginibacillus halophilus]PSL44053.1 putative membrane protein YdjX (TVP38/TMEM64 family) [Salsuginibacillus halophilus]
MEAFIDAAVAAIQDTGWMAPLLFLGAHILRQLLMLPVATIGILGGLLFGTFYGTLFSMIGLTIVSLMFYAAVKLWPALRRKLTEWKNKWMGGKEELTLAQIMILRCVPFLHFHLVNAYLMEISSNWRDYTKYSFIASLPPALIYTSFGHGIRELPWYVLLFITVVLVLLFLLSRSKTFTHRMKSFFASR